MQIVGATDVWLDDDDANEPRCVGGLNAPTADDDDDDDDEEEGTLKPGCCCGSLKEDEEEEIPPPPSTFSIFLAGPFVCTTTPAGTVVFSLSIA